MKMQELALQRRSIRRFTSERIEKETLEAMVDTARLYPSGGNLQPLRFAVVTEPEKTEKIFADLRWAMYLPEFTVAPHEQPTAYIVLLRDEKISRACQYDVGAASTMLMLAATERGIATCAIGNYHKERLCALLELPAHLKPELVLALGYPAQESHVVELTDSVRYTQDEAGNMLVPKRSLEQILW